MQKLYTIAFFCILTMGLNAQIGIGTSNPDESAILEIKGNNGGILIPRMTSLQRKNIPATKPGLMVYDATLNKFMVTSIFNDTMLWAPLGPLWNESANAVYLDSNFIKPMGIGTTDPAPGTLMDIAGVGGVKIPGINSMQRSNLPVEDPGVMVYDETINKMMVSELFNDTILWKSLGPNWLESPQAIYIDKPVGVGTSNPIDGALLELKGLGGMKLPEMETTDREGLPAEDPGLIVYDETLNQLMTTTLWNDTMLWRSLDTYWQHSGQKVSLDTDINAVGIGTSNPQANLHVDGSVIFEDLGGNGIKPLGVDEDGTILKFNDTMMVAFNALNFKSNLPITTEFAEEYIASGLTFEGNGTMWIPIEPAQDGFISDTFMVSYVDASSANLAISLVEAKLDGGSSMSTMGSITTSGNNPGDIQTMGFGFPPGTEIDVFNNQYFIKVSSSNWGIGNLRIIGGVLRCVRL